MVAVAVVTVAVAVVAVKVQWRSCGGSREACGEAFGEISGGLGRPLEAWGSF